MSHSKVIDEIVDKLFEEVFGTETNPYYGKFVNNDIVESIKYCGDCVNAYEDEDVDGCWRLYCIKKIGNKDGSEVTFNECCKDFEERIYKNRT